MEFDISKFAWDKARAILSAEASDLELTTSPRQFKIKGKTKSVTFYFTHHDWAGCGSDAEIVGTWYACKGTVYIRALIIND